MITNRLKNSLAAVAFFGVLVFVTGCPAPAPAPEAVLAGTWSLAPLGPNVSNYLITFDDTGTITRLQYTFTDPDTGVSVKVDIDQAKFITSSSAVNGSDVSITATWLSVNNMVFSGTINADNTVMTGSASYVLRV